MNCGNTCNRKTRDRRHTVDINETIEILKTCQVFDGLGRSELRKIAEGCVIQSVPMGTTIIEENDPPKGTLYFIKYGDLAVSTGQIDIENAEVKDESLITTLGPGDAFGEIALVDEMPHSATVRTISDAAILHLPARFLHNLCEQEPTIGLVVYRNLAKIICTRLRMSNFSTKHFWFSD